MSTDIEPTNPPTARRAWLASTATSILTAGITFGVWAKVTRHDCHSLPDPRLLCILVLAAYCALLFVMSRRPFTLLIAIPYGAVFGALCVVTIPAVLAIMGWQ